MKRLFTITAVILLLVAALTIVGCKSGGNKTPEETESPMDILMDVFDKTAASRDNGEEATESIWQKAEAAGAIGMDLTLPTGLPLQTITSKQYYGNTAAAFYDITNTKGDKLSFSSWEENDKFVLTASPWDKNYGVTYDDLSVLLGYFKGVDSTLDLAKLTTGISELEDAFLALSDELEAVLEQYAEIDPVMTDDGLSVKIRVSGKNTPLFIKAVYDVFKNDTDFYSAIDTIGIALGGNAEDLFNDSEINTLCENLEDDPIAILTTLSCNNVRVMRKAVITLVDEEMTGDELSEDSGNVTYGKERLNFTLTLGQDGDYGFEILSDEEEYSFDYDVTDSETRHKVAISVGTSTVRLTPVTYTYSKQDNTFRVNVDIPSTLSAEFSGSYNETETTATLLIDNITYTTYASNTVIPGLSIGIPVVLSAKLQLTAELNATATACPTEYTEFSDLTEEEIAALTEALANDPVLADTVAFLEVLAQLGGADTDTPDSGDSGFGSNLGDIFGNIFDNIFT